MKSADVIPFYRGARERVSMGEIGALVSAYLDLSADDRRALMEFVRGIVGSQRAADCPEGG